MLTAEERNTVRKEIFATGRTLTGYARVNGFHILTFRMWLRGAWGTGCNGNVSRSYERAVRKDFLKKTRVASRKKKA